VGQPVVVTKKVGARPGTIRYELNRSLTGMAHERYRAGEEITGNRPPDELARRLFAHGGLTAVHIYSNIVTVELDGPREAEAGNDLVPIIEDLYTYYREGVTPAMP